MRELAFLDASTTHAAWACLARSVRTRSDPYTLTAACSAPAQTKQTHACCSGSDPTKCAKTMGTVVAALQPKDTMS